MSDYKIEEAIQAKGLTAPRVTPAQIDDLMYRIIHSFEVIGTSTFCHGFLDGKFYLDTGHSACVSPENFNEGIGRQIAYEAMARKCRDKLWELEGYALYKQIV